MNKSFYISVKALWSDQRHPSSSPPQYRSWAKMWLTLCVLMFLMPFSVQSQTGGALSFDGTDDHVSFSSSGMSASAGTMEFWVNTISTGGTQMYIDLWQEQFTVYSTGTTIRARIAGTDLSASFTPGQWNHLALTWGGNGATARLYLNGVQVASGTQGSTTIGSTTGYLSRSQSFGGYYVSCTMDEVRLWNIQRSATDIANNYCSEISASTSGLQNYYKFNQGTASGSNSGVNSLTDETSNGRNGSLVNFTLSGSSSNWVAGTSLAGVVTPSVSIAGSPSGSIVYGTSVTFTATPTHGGTSPSYQWKKNGTNVGTNSATYTDAALNNGDAITCVMTSNAFCATSTTATSNSVTMTVTYPAGAALNFDGTNDYVALPNTLATAVTGSGTATALTIEYWFKGSNLSSGVRLQPAGDYIVAGWANSGNVLHIISTDGGTTGISAGAAATINNGNWHHIAMTWEKNTTNGFKSYLDGVLVAQRNSANVNLPNITSGMYLGTVSGGTELINGSLDEVRIWNRALPQCEIQNNMNCELGSGQTGLTAYYKFNQGSGFTSNAGVTTLTDASGNGRDGTLFNLSLTGTTSNWISTGGVTTGTTCTALPAPSVSIAGSPSGSIAYGTSVTFTATPTNGGTTPQYQWKKNNVNVGTNSATYTDATLNNNDVITCVLTNNTTCTSPTTATSNSVTMTVTYPAGAGLSFDGTDDWVTIPHNAAFNITGGITIEAWIKTTKTTENYIVTKGEDSYFLAINIGNNLGKLSLYLNSVSGWLTSTRSVTDGNWHHVAAVRNGTTVQLYIDGVLDATGTGANGNIGTGTAPVYIGVRSGTNTFFSGSMDEVRIWNRALLQCEIQNNMNCELGSGQTGLAAYYKFNQGFGFTSNAGVTSLTDASGNNLTGTLNNFSLTGTTSNWVSTGGVTTGTTCTALPTPSVSIAGSPSGSIAYGTSVTFTATPTNGGATPVYQWKKNNVNVGTNSTTYTDAALANGDVITCVLTNCTVTGTSNSITMTVTHPAGAGLSFDGVDDYIYGVKDDNLRNMSAFTLEAWIKPQAAQLGNILGYEGNTWGAYSLQIDANRKIVLNISHTGNSWETVVGSTSLTLNTWTHVAAVWAGNTIQVYVNGVLDGSASSTASPLHGTDADDRLRIGRTGWDGGPSYFLGSIDEVRIWNRALPLCEIQNNRNCELGSGQTGLLAYYKFNQGFGFTSNAGVTSLTDDSGNNRTGTLTNFGLTGTTSNWVSTGGVTTGTTCTAYTAPSVAIAGSPSGSIVYGTSVTFTATPTNSGATPTYQWKKNGTNVGTNSITYTDAALNNNDVITCVLTNACGTTATSNSITMTVTYPAGAALHFDGVNDFVDGPKDNALRNMTSLTLEAWIRPTSAQDMVIMSYDGDNWGAYQLNMSANRKVDFMLSNGNSWQSVTQIGTISLNTWTHIAGVWSNNTLQLYVNGVLDGTATTTFTSLSGLNTDDKLRIGRSGWTTSPRYFLGSMDEVRIWNRALPQCEIQNNMSCELGATQTGLLAYYKFNQGFGFTSNAGVTSLTDASGNNRTGTLTNFGLTGTTSNWVSTGGVTTGTTCTAYTAPSVAIAASPTGSIITGTSVTFTATPTNSGATPVYQWKKNNVNVGTNSTTYTDAALANGDVITCVLTNACNSTATSNSITMTVTGPPGAALHFDGTDDYVAISNTLPNVSSTFTLEAWVNPDAGYGTYNDAAEPQEVISRWGLGGANNASYRLGISPSGQAVCYVYNGSNSTAVTSTTTVPVNTWTHIAATRAADNTLSIYINGVLSASVSNAVVPQSSNYQVYLGKPIVGNNKYRGRVDEVRIWNRALPLCEIQNNRNCELGSGQTGLLAYYKFNQGFSSTNNAGVTSLTDDSGNSLTGTLTNFGLTGTTSNWVGTGGVTTGTTCTALLIPSVSIAITAGSQTICSGTSVTFTATPTNGGTTPTYQWKNNGTNISGATSATYTSTTLANNDAITCVMTSNLTCPSTPTATSNSLTMTVNPTVTPSVSIAASATSVPEGTSVTFTATPTNGGTTPTYQWQKGGVNISGATNATYTTTSLVNGDIITCVMTSNATCISAATATSNAITMTVTAPLGAALHFDGSNDYVDLGTGFGNFGTGNFTIETKFKSGAANDGEPAIISKRGNGCNHSSFWSLAFESGRIALKINQNTSGLNQFYIATPLSYNDNVWHHLAVTRNEKLLQIYVDGILVQSQTTPAITNISNTTSVKIGNSPCGSYSGALDELRIWNRAVPQCEIQNNMNCELGSGQTGLVAYYKFNQGLGNTNNAGITSLTDASGNNNNGTLTNFGLTGTVSNWIAGGGVTTGTSCSPISVPTPSVSITATSTNIATGTSVTFTATPTNGGASPFYQWKQNGVNVGTNSATYTNASLLNGDVITCVMTSNLTCVSATTATSNSLTMTVTGASPSTALDFDGTNDYVQFSNTGISTSAGTVELWIKNGTTTAPYQMFFDLGGESFTIFTYNNRMYFRAGSLSPGSAQFSTPNSKVNVWTHVALVWNGPGQTFYGYINGVLVGGATQGYTAITGSLGKLGQTTLVYDYPYKGSMDEVRIWNRALPLCEIKNNMTGELGSGQTGLSAYYKFNQGLVNANNAGITTLTDASGNDRHATLNGFGLTGTSSNWVSGGGVSAGTTAATYTTPSVSVSANNTSVCVGNSFVLTSTPIGLGNKIAYQWESSTNNINWTTVRSAFSATYSTSIRAVGTTYYRLKATDGCGTIYSASITITGINPSLSVTADATQACQGTVVTLTAATTTGTPTYQWQSSTNLSSWSNISGATAATFTPSTSTVGTMYYRVVATYGSGCVLNSTAQTLAVSAAPTASVTGGNVTVGQGSTASNLTAVINSPFAAVFQWQSSADGTTGWADIPNSNNLVYTPSTDVAGTQYYRLKVTFAPTASVCNVTIYSNARRVTVEAAPVVTISLSGDASQRLLAGETIVCSGTNLTLTSSCTDATATPSWTGPNGFTASTANITLSNLTSANSGLYRVIYLTTTGYIGEQTITIKVAPTLTVSKTVSTTNIIQGGSSQITVKPTVIGKIDFGSSKVLTATNTALGSQPFFAANDDSEGQQWWLIPVSGGILNLSQRFYIQSVSTGLYLRSSAVNRDVIELGTFSNISNLEWYVTPQKDRITRASVNTLVNGNGRMLDDKAIQLITPKTGNLVACKVTERPSAITLAWNDGNTSSSRTVSPTTTTNYIATFTTAAGCVVKDTTTITVLPVPTITVVPNASTICQGQVGTLSTNVTSNLGTPTYIWQSSFDNTNWTTIVGATSSTYILPTTAASNLYYRSIVTNYFGTYTSAGVQVTVVALPSVSVSASQPVTCPNGATTLTATYTSGFGTASFQWQSSTDGNSNWTDISGATNATYVPSTGSVGVTYYRCNVTLSGSCIPLRTSQGVSITVNPTLTVGVSGVATESVCKGTYRVLTLTTNVTGATYVWESSTNGTTWTTIANETKATFIPSTTTAGTMYYRGTATLGCSATSATRQLTVTEIPTLTVGSPVSAVCLDRAVSFSASLSSTSAGTPSFVWQTSKDNLNWSTQAGATGSSFTQSATAIESIYIRAGVKFAACADSSFSVPKPLTVNATPTATLYVPTIRGPRPASTNLPASICDNSTLLLSPTLTGGTSTPIYQWQKSPVGGFFATWSNISGATSSSYTVQPSELTPATGTATYRLIVKNGSYCPEIASNEVKVTKIVAPSVTATTTGTSICQGSQATLTGTTLTGATYKWQSSPDGTTWTDIPGATATTYIYNAQTLGTTQFRFSALSDVCAAVNSTPLTIAVGSNVSPTLTLAVNNSTLCGEAEVVVSATASGLGATTPQYTWTRNGQPYVGQPTTFTTKTTADGLGSNTINDMVVVGNMVYLATDNGLAVSSDGGATFSNKTTANGLLNNKVTSLAVHPDGVNVIVGTPSGSAFSRNSGNSFNTFLDKLGISTSSVVTMRAAPNGSLVVGSTSSGNIEILNFGSSSTRVSPNVGTFNSITFKDRDNVYLVGNGGMKLGKYDGTLSNTYSFSNSPLTALAYKRVVLKGDTIYATSSTNGFNYFINNVAYTATGLPTTGIEDVMVNDNTVYVTATSGLYVSKNGGKTFTDITSSTGLGTNPGLKRILLGTNNIYIVSSSGLKISSLSGSTLTYTTNKSDKIQCLLTTTGGVCSNTVKDSLTLNYIGDIDPTSIKVAVNETTGTGTWTAVNNATGYGWELMKFSPDRSSKTFVKNGTVTTNSVTLSDLNPSSNYELTVKTLCNISQAFARLANATGSGAGGSTSFTTGFVVPQVIKDSLLKASTLCAEDTLKLGPGFPADYEVYIYSGADKTYIDYASVAHPFKVKLTGNTNYFYKVFKSDVKVYTFTASNNDAGSESKRYTVPTGVSKITFKAGGSRGGGIYGGNGGITIGSVTPTAGTTYYLFPGTTTTADAGLSRGTATSSNGGGGSYVSTSSLRKDALLVAGGGGGGGTDIFVKNIGGIGGLISGNGVTTNTGANSVTGGNATSGGVSQPTTTVTGPIFTLINPRTASGFMKGSSTNNVTSTLRKGDNGGGGGYYGGGSYINIQARIYAGGGGGSSYANTTLVRDVLYEDGINAGTGYVTVYEYAQATANSDFLPLNIVVMPVPVLANAQITLNPAVPVLSQNMSATFSMTGNAGFETFYTWFSNISGPQTITVPTSQVRNSSSNIFERQLSCSVGVKYCINRFKDINKTLFFTATGAMPPDSDTDTSSNRGGRLLTPAVSIASSTTNICAGEQVIITATPTGIADENLSYLWRKNGAILFGESNNVLQTSSLSNGDVITCTLFYPSVTNGADSVVSTNSITMTVATPATPSVTIAASANNVCPGTAITFTPTPTAGGTSPQYQWYLNGDLVQTSDTYTSSSFENSDYVECIMVSNATCLAQTESEISASVSINLKPEVTPTATVFVLDTLICSSGPTSLTVRTENVGSTPQYQWRHNGAPVGNNADYYPISVSHNDAIWCEVTPSADACANTNYIESNTELVQTADADAIFTPLATITVDKDSICTGDSLTFNVEGNYLGSTPQYVWKKNGTTLDGTDPFITLASIANGDIITCVATSSLGCVSTAEATSNALTAKVVTPATPIVSISTDNTTICPNIPVVISATPTYGGSFPVYNWRLNGNAHNALPHEFFNYTTEDGLGGNYTQAVFVRNDTVFAATAGGVSYRIKGDSLYQTLSYDKGLETSNVQAIYVDDSGVYAGTDEGLSISTDGLNSFRPINTVRSGLSSGNITAITAIGSTLFVGTDNGLNISTDGGNSFTTKKTTEGLASNRIRHLFVDGTTLYVGTEGGLNITTNNGTTFTTKTIADSLNSDTVLGVWAKGTAIYAATQQGLAVSNDGGTTFTKLTMDNGLPNNQVNGVWVVADSMVYAATSGGLGISKNGGKTFRGYYETDSLGSNTVLGITVANGRIFAATTDGLSISDPSKIRVYPNDGDVFATNLASNKSCVATSTAISNNLTFHVGTVSASSLATTIVMNTSATLTWTGTTSSYNWVVVPTGTGVNGTVVASGSTSTLPVSVTGLTSATTYDLFVQGACTPEGTVDWVGPLTFTTKDDAFVSVKTFLQGAYSTSTGLMGDNLRSLNLIPTTEPYTGMTGFTHVNGGGGEKVTSTVLAVTGNNAIVDWVFVELRDKTTPTTVIATRSALIQRDGDVVDVDGVSPVGFNVMADDYYVVVRHRNHLGIRTASTIALNKTSATPYDFTTAASQALSSIQKDLTGGKFGMYGGNVNSNNTVRASGPSSINDYLRLINLLGTSSNIQSNVYSTGDVNMDGTMRASGPSSINDYLKIINSIGSSAAIITQPF